MKLEDFKLNEVNQSQNKYSTIATYIQVLIVAKFIEHVNGGCQGLVGGEEWEISLRNTEFWMKKF